jgi:hypothetical protein
MSYPHRVNADLSVDSICTRCYRTVASTRYVWDLSHSEAAHVCDPERLKTIEELLGFLPANPAALRRSLSSSQSS